MQLEQINNNIEQKQSDQANQTQLLFNKIVTFLICFFAYSSVSSNRICWSQAKTQIELQNLGYVDSSFLFCYSISMKFLGSYGDRINLKYFIGIGMILTSFASSLIGIIAFFEIKELWITAVLMGLSGVTSSTLWPGFMAVMGNWFNKNECGLVMGIYVTCYNVGIIFGYQLIGNAVFQWYPHLGWRFCILFGGIYLFIFGFIVIIFLKPYQNENQQIKKQAIKNMQILKKQSIMIPMNDIQECDDKNIVQKSNMCRIVPINTNYNLDSETTLMDSPLQYEKMKQLKNKNSAISVHETDRNEAFQLHLNKIDEVQEKQEVPIGDEEKKSSLKGQDQQLFSFQKCNQDQSPNKINELFETKSTFNKDSPLQNQKLKAKLSNCSSSSSNNQQQILENQLNPQVSQINSNNDDKKPIIIPTRQILCNIESNQNCDSPKKEENPNNQYNQQVQAIIQLQQEQENKLNYFTAWLVPGVALYALAYASLKSTYYGFFFWLPTYLKSQNVDFINIASMFEYGMLLSGVVFGKISDKTKKIATLLSISILISCFLILSVKMFLKDNQIPYYLVIFGIGFFFGGPYLMISTTITIELGNQKVLKGNKKSIATISSLIESSGSFCAAIIQIICQIIGDNLFYLFTALTFSAALVLIYIACKKKNIEQ